MPNFIFYSKEIFDELSKLDLIQWDHNYSADKLIELISNTFEITFNNINKTDIPREEVFKTSGIMIYRLLEIVNCIKCPNEEVRDAVIDFIIFYIKSKCQSIEISQRLIRKCQELIDTKEG